MVGSMLRNSWTMMLMLMMVMMMKRIESITRQMSLRGVVYLLDDLVGGPEDANQFSRANSSHLVLVFDVGSIDVDIEHVQARVDRLGRAKLVVEPADGFIRAGRKSVCAGGRKEGK